MPSQRASAIAPSAPSLRAAALALAILTGCLQDRYDAGPDSDAGALADLGVDALSDLDQDGADGADLASDPAPDGNPTDAPFDSPPSDVAEEADAIDTADARDADASADAPDAPDGGPDPDPFLPARYRGDAIRSPITAFVAESLRDIAAVGTGADDVFMKVGASGTVSHNLLYCFAGPDEPEYDLDLDGRDALMPTIEFFRGGDAAGTTPFDRATLAAMVGRSAVWAISGDPSPLEQEIAAIDPRFAFVNYGTNDMGLGATYQSALWPFYDNFTALLDQLLAAGIIPIVTGLNPRDDSAAAARWVPTYDAVTRGVAEARQLPYISMYLASRDLPNLGLLSDGIHGNVYSVSGQAQPCVFTAAALAFNYNVRNLHSIEVLDAVRAVVLEGAEAPDPNDDLLQGAGTDADPFVVDRLPFTHWADTSDSPQSAIDGYPPCDTGQDESGPEYTYVMSLASETRVRAMVFDGAGVDIDLHLLGQDGSAGSCVARNDRIVQRTLAAGTHRWSLDTFVSGGTPDPGPYLLVIVECEAGDAACD